jgi:hypothetical protein
MVARFPDFLFSLPMQHDGPLMNTDSANSESTRRPSWTLTAVVVLMLALGTSRPAQAGVVSDAIDDIGSFLSDLDRSVSEWFFGVVETLDRPDRMELAAETIRRMAVEGPGPLAAMAEEAGFSLTGYKISQENQGSLVLTFGFEREVETDSRMVMWRDVLQAAEVGTRPELELTRALLDASDWRQVDIGPDYKLVGVEIEVAERLRTQMVYDLVGQGG